MRPLAQRCLLALILALLLARPALSQDSSGAAGVSQVPAATTPATTPTTIPTISTPTTVLPTTSPTTVQTTPTTPTTSPTSETAVTTAPTTSAATTAASLTSSTPTTDQTAASSSAPVTSSGASDTRAASTGSSSTLVIMTVTSVLPNGEVTTGLASSFSAMPSASSSASSNSGGGSGKTWAIVGGVAGGVLGLAGLVFVVFRCTQKRFSDLDDDDVAIKWPELVNRGEDATTLNPLAARQGNGHGVGDDGDEEKRYANTAYSDGHGSYPSRSPTILNSNTSTGPSGYIPDPSGGQGYYDPYLGPSAAPQPFPPNIPPHEQMYPPTHAAPYADYANLPGPAGAVGAGLSGRESPMGRVASPSNTNDPRLSMGSQGNYRMSWGGGEAIPMSVVNTSGGPTGGSSAADYWVHPGEDGHGGLEYMHEDAAGQQPIGTGVLAGGRGSPESGSGQNGQRMSQQGYR